MKNTIKTLLIIMGLMEGNAAFAQNQNITVIFTPGPNSSYTFTDTTGVCTDTVNTAKTCIYTPEQFARLAIGVKSGTSDCQIAVASANPFIIGSNCVGFAGTNYNPVDPSKPVYINLQ